MVSKSQMIRILKSFGLIGRRFKKDQTEQLVHLGANHFARDYPNSERKNCPPLELPGELVQSGKLPGDELREHLFTCSECFVHYREELLRHRESESGVAAIESTSHKTRTPRLVPVLAAALVGIVTISAVLLVTRKQGPSGDLANVNSNLDDEKYPAREDQPPGLRSTSPALTLPPASTPPRPPSPKRRSNSRPLVAENRLTIDIDRYNALRGAGRSEERPVLLKTTKNNLTIKMPDGSPAGRYRVSLADPFGTPLQSVEIISRDGLQLRLHLDLSSVKAGKYFVCLDRETEVPQCVPAVIEPGPNKK